ncbi:MAG: phosphoglycerate kinase [Candidatus Dasytiphilus stammeri]
MSIMKMTHLNLSGKRVFIRADLNVPLNKEGRVTSEARINAFIPTIKIALKKGARIMVTSHLGRPVEGKYQKAFSLGPIVEVLKKKISCPIRLEKNYLEGLDLAQNEVVILENVRFNKGEKKNDELLAKKYASLCDIFVMDAFGSSHRKDASTYGIIKFAPIACAGPLLEFELEALSKAVTQPQRPMVAIIGGSKISTKFDILNYLAQVSDKVIVGGGIANTFVAIENRVGESLYEPDFVEAAKILRDSYYIPIPIDVRVGSEFSELSPALSKSVAEIDSDEEIMDWGEKTTQIMTSIIKKAKTILWNGPVGVFEFPNFSTGTRMIAEAITESHAYSIAGGGDTQAAIELFGVEKHISYMSTGGGAFLSFVEGKKLPAIRMLEDRAQHSITNKTLGG